MVLMWGAESNTPFHVMHFGFPIGAILAGQIARAFVSQNITDNSTEMSDLMLLPQQKIDILSHELDEYNDFLDDSRIESGFLVVSFYTASVALACTILQFMTKEKHSANKKAYSWNEIFHPSQWGGESSCFAIIIYSLFVLLQLGLLGSDHGLTYYLATYAVDSDLGFSHQEAATLTSVYYLADAIGVFICIFISHYLSIKHMFLIESHAMFISSGFLLIFGTSNKISFYVLVSVFSLFKGPAWAATYAWPDLYIILLSTILASSVIVRSVYEAFLVALQGYLYTNTTTDSIFYTAVVNAGIMCVLMYIVYYVTWNKPGRHKIVSKSASSETCDATDTDRSGQNNASTEENITTRL